MRRPPDSREPSTLLGIPAISIPCGLTADGFPLGLQLVAPAFFEKKLLGVAEGLERLLKAAA